MFKEKNNLFVLMALIALFGGMTLVLYHYREEIHLPEFFKESQPFGGEAVGCSFVTNIEGKHLRLKFLIPSKDRRDHTEIERIVPKIKHDLLMSMGRPEIERHFENRDFSAVRTHLLHIVNSHSRSPVEHIYLEAFFCD
ncbi:MAG: hypothetical protein JW821_11120 [Deltaproteobacteria bacterium]|nr:hypothetical protein [Deltaproteobacteria bacterium]